MNWGTRIVIAFVCFAGVITTMVVISMKQEVNLVAKDYYKQEIAYQDQIDRKDNYNQLHSKPRLKMDAASNVIQVQFPIELKNTFKNGELHMFRPSSAKFDKKYKLDLDDNGFQQIDMNTMPNGVWKAKLSWNSEDKEYYTEIVMNK